jgi:oxygen-independent coproporphyrinogen-3 oxidase
MLKELKLRKDFFNNDIVDSIYFGGGTPSLIDAKLIGEFILHVKENFKVSEDIEITLELNPDDSSIKYLTSLKENHVNRLSIGIQSFNQEDLFLMNRSHTANQSYDTIKMVKDLFDNFSLDLIYGIPHSNIDKWKFNLNEALSFDPPHISSYALTVEDKTILKKQILSGELIPLGELDVEKQYWHMINYLEEINYHNYEFSNFSKPGYYSKNNLGYWGGKAYLGIGPSAHSFDGNMTRSWNVSQNMSYLNSIKKNSLPLSQELLSLKDRFNELIMTGLRTSSGVSTKEIKDKIGEKFVCYLEDNAKKRVLSKDLYWDGDYLHVSKKSKFLSDGIASDLFLINL